MADPADSPAPPRRRLGRILAWGVVASFIGIWGYVMYLSFFVGRAEPRDRLSDEAFRASAEAACAPHREVIDALPFASELDTLEERARVLDEATDELEDLVADLEAVTAPTEADEARAVERWIIDWHEYLDNRRAYADRFRAGLDEPFRVTDRDGEQIDTAIDGFAHINFMDSCRTPEDV